MGCTFMHRTVEARYGMEAGSTAGRPMWCSGALVRPRL